MQKMMYICAMILTSSLHAMEEESAIIPTSSSQAKHEESMIAKYDDYSIKCRRGDNKLAEKVNVTVNFIEKSLERRKKEFFDHVNKDTGHKKYDCEETAPGFKVTPRFATLVINFALVNSGISFQSHEIDVKKGDGLVFHFEADNSYRIDLESEDGGGFLDKDTIENAITRYREHKKLASE